MSQYDSRLFTVKWLKEMAEVADDISEQCTLMTDALSGYEDALDQSGEEAKETREQARDEAWQAMGEILTEVEKLTKMRERLELEE